MREHASDDPQSYKKQKVEQLADWKLVIWIYEKIVLRFLDERKEAKRLRQMQVMIKQEAKMQVRQQYTVLISKSLLVFLGLQMAALLITGITFFQKDSRSITFYRDTYEGESIACQLQGTYAGEKISLPLTVMPQQYSAKQIEHFFKTGFVYAKKAVLGENRSQQNISKKLNLITQIPDSPLHISWWWEEEELLAPEGKIQFSAFSGEAVVMLHVILSYEKEKREQTIPLILRQPEYSKTEQQIRKVRQYLSAQEKKTRQQQSFSVPQKIGKISLQKDKSSSKEWILWALSLFLPVMIWMKYKQEQNQKLKQRKEQLLDQYPQFVNQLSLYLGAGMTIKQCFGQLTAEYERKKCKTKERQYLYEECSAMLSQIHAGQSEKDCYRELGERLQVNCYSKLMTMLEQNLSKGSSGLLESLDNEVRESFEMRKERAKKKGEEAGTKLLFPMLLLLVTIMMIILVPAMFGFVQM